MDLYHSRIDFIPQYNLYHNVNVFLYHSGVDFIPQWTLFHSRNDWIPQLNLLFTTMQLTPYHSEIDLYHSKIDLYTIVALA